MIAYVDAAVYSVLLLDLLLRVQMIVNPRKNCNSHLIDSKTVYTLCMSDVYTISMYMYIML